MGTGALERVESIQRFDKIMVSMHCCANFGRIMSVTKHFLAQGQ